VLTPNRRLYSRARPHGTRQCHGSASMAVDNRHHISSTHSTIANCNWQSWTNTPAQCSNTWYIPHITHDAFPSISMLHAPRYAELKFPSNETCRDKTGKNNNKRTVQWSPQGSAFIKRHDKQNNNQQMGMQWWRAMIIYNSFPCPINHDIKALLRGSSPAIPSKKRRNALLKNTHAYSYFFKSCHRARPHKKVPCRHWVFFSFRFSRKSLMLKSKK